MPDSTFAKTIKRPDAVPGERWTERLLRSKLFVVACLVLPGLWPVWPLLRQEPSVLADPGKYLLHHLGFVACVLLAVVLTFTPLRTIFPRSPEVRALNRHRRLVGVTVFVYAGLHFIMYLIYEGGFGTLTNDIGKPFILSGAVALAILLVLAVTSLDRVVRTLGGRRWRNLHRLVYFGAALAAYHQIAASKLFPIQVVWIFGPMLVLQAGRLLKRHVIST
ncbi:MAG TPA: ferric reductase-like transmembrane domain-containing protein [Opitutaceae bacterium]|nr:ferric reductase-like transmembrane domain-containing protein [Opitutaceae bacterium]